MTPPKEIWLVESPTAFWFSREPVHDLPDDCVVTHMVPAQPEQEPAAWWIPKAEQFCLPSSDGTRPFAKAWEPLYTTPPQRNPLTREQRIQIVKDNTVQGYHGDYFDAWGIIDDVEAAHGIKE